jgi:hypothetical protein
MRIERNLILVHTPGYQDVVDFQVDQQKKAAGPTGSAGG